MKVPRPTLPIAPRELDEFTGVLSDVLNNLVTVLNGRISLGDAKAGSANIEGHPLDVADTGTADTEFILTHNLGRVPVFYLWNTSKSGTVYDSQRSLWTTSTLRLKCSAANAALKVFVFG